MSVAFRNTLSAVWTTSRRLSDEPSDLDEAANDMDDNPFLFSFGQACLSSYYTYELEHNFG